MPLGGLPGRPIFRPRSKPEPRNVLPLSRMWSDFLAWVDHHRIGAPASLGGVAISLGGFAATIFNVARSRTAAQQAKDAAEAAREGIRLHNVVADLSAAVQTMEEIQRLHRLNQWQLLPDRYSLLRRQLVAVESTSTHLSQEQRRSLQTARADVADICQQIEWVLDSGEQGGDVSEMNARLSARTDELYRILISLRSG